MKHFAHTSLFGTSLFALALGSVACSFHARSPDDYRDDTRALLESRSGEIKACYDDVLKTDPNAAGRVTVTFTVTEDTGQIADAAVDPSQTTAPPALGDCVVRSINGLALTPPDARPGMATFTYDFMANPPRQVSVRLVPNRG